MYEVSNLKDVIRNVLKVKLLTVSLSIFPILHSTQEEHLFLCVCTCTFQIYGLGKNEEDSNLENANCTLKNVKPFYFTLPSLEFF